MVTPAIGMRGVYTIQEAMAELNVSRRTIYNYIEREILTFLRDPKTNRLIFSAKGLERVREWKTQSRERMSNLIRRVTKERVERQRLRKAEKDAIERSVFIYITTENNRSIELTSHRAKTDLIRAYSFDALVNAMHRKAVFVYNFNRRRTDLDEMRTMINSIVFCHAGQLGIDKLDHIYYATDDPSLDDELVNPVIVDMENHRQVQLNPLLKHISQAPGFKERDREEQEYLAKYIFKDAPEEEEEEQYERQHLIWT